LHGLGNDYVVIDGAAERLPDSSLGRVAQIVTDRHFGIGSDGFIVVMPSDSADLRMRILNVDGSEAEMCGNGIRCLAKFAYDRGLVKKTDVTVETLGGLKALKLDVDGGKMRSATVDMGPPRLERDEIPTILPGEGPAVNEPLVVDGTKFMVTCVSAGNPHCITYVDDVLTAPVTTMGPLIERHPMFPRKTNVEFIHVIGPAELDMRVWERGVGETMACGTGACSSVVAGVLNGVNDRRATVHLPGGDLFIDWVEGGSVFMTGPAEEAFTGEIDIAL
jgi:diaminopimelate epimerase